MKTLKFLTVLVVVLSSNLVFGQCISSQHYQKTYGGISNDYTYCISRTNDGGAIIGGHTLSYGAGGVDAYIVKVDACGNWQWSKAYGGAQDDRTSSATQTSDGGYMLVNYSSSFTIGDWDFQLIKTDNLGNVQWQSSYGSSGADYPRDGIQTADGGYLIGGVTNGTGAGGNDYVVFKVDGTGALQWTKTYGNSANDFLDDVDLTPDGGFIMTGYRRNYTVGREGYIIKADSLGNVQWAREIFGPANEHIRGGTVLANGNYLFSGSTTSYGAGNNDMMLTEIDLNGNLLWSKAYGGVMDDAGIDVRQATDGTLWLLGTTESFGSGGKDNLLFHLDNTGNLIDAYTIGGSGAEDNVGIASSMFIDNFDNIVFAGHTVSFGAGGFDVYLVKTDVVGDPICESVAVTPVVTIVNPSFVANTPTVTNPIYTVTNQAPNVVNTPSMDSVVCDPPSIQNPCVPGSATTFQKTLGAAGNERAHAIKRTNDGGFIVAGETTSFGAGGKDWFVMKTDALGNPVWTRAIGSTGTEDGWSISIEQTSDLGYIVVGETTSFGANGRDPYIVKLDNAGVIQWESRISSNGNTYFRDVLETQDGNYIAVGTTNSFGAGNSDFYAVKYDALGNLIWTNTYGGFSTEHATSIIEISPNSFVLAGGTETYGAGSDDGFLVKIDENGAVIWSRAYGGNNRDVFMSVELMSDGHLVSTGYSETFGLGQRSILVVKSDTLGNEIWTKVYAGTGSERGVNVQEKGPDVIAISAVSNSVGAGANDILLLEIDSSGTLNRTIAYGGISNDEVDLWGEGLLILNDSTAMIAGGTTSFGQGGDDIYLIKSNPCGDSFCNDNVVTLTEFTPSLVTSVVAPLTGNGGARVVVSSDNNVINFAPDTLCFSGFQCNVTANFSALQFCEGDSTNFTDLSIDSVGTIVSWQWYFGDGDSIMGVQNPAHLYASPGNYNVTLQVTTDSNCTDSFTLPIVINPVFSINRADSICQGDSILLGGVFQTTAGVYVDSLQTILGCDSVVSTTLVVNPVFSSVQNSTICQGDSILFNGNFYSSAGLFTDSLQTVRGCDSLLSLNLSVIPIVQNNQNASICQGDSILLGGAFQNTTGLYTDSFQTALGCDSLIITTLTVGAIHLDTITASMCQGDSLLVGGAFQNSAGLYTDSLQTTLGCDSIVTTDLSVDTATVISVTSDTTASPCFGVQLNASGGSSYLWSPVDYLSCANCPNPVASPPITTTYTVTDPSSNCVSPNAVTVTVIGDASFFIPNVFTPNGDGQNDLFNVSSDCIISLEKKVYNRWGQLLFVSNQINEGWNGRTTAGAEAPTGTYFYIITVGYYEAGTETAETFTGYVTLLR